MSESGFYTYMLRCADGTLYTGWTTHVENRLAAHNLGKGARYTRGRRPVELMAAWCFPSKSEAMKFEYWLKTLPRATKENLAQEAAKQAKKEPVSPNTGLN